MLILQPNDKEEENRRQISFWSKPPLLPLTRAFAASLKPPPPQATILMD